MGSRHPLPYAFAKAHNLLLEDDGQQLMLWAAETTSASALSEVTRLFDVAHFEREPSSTLGQRIAVAYAGGESSAAAVIGEVESGVDLSRMTDDLSATLVAARKLIAGPELQLTLSELAQTATSLKRLSATLDQRLPRLASSAQGTLQEASQASARLGTAADKLGSAADRVGGAAARAENLLAADSRVVLGVQQAADELSRAAAALRAAASDESATVQGVQRAMADLSRAARAVRELADTIEQQPQSLIRGKAAPP